MKSCGLRSLIRGALRLLRIEISKEIQIQSALPTDERFMTIMRDSPSLHAFRAVTWLTVYRAPQVTIISIFVIHLQQFLTSMFEHNLRRAVNRQPGHRAEGM